MSYHLVKDTTEVKNLFRKKGYRKGVKQWVFLWVIVKEVREALWIGKFLL